jgi:hypothetical protein
LATAVAACLGIAGGSTDILSDDLAFWAGISVLGIGGSLALGLGLIHIVRPRGQSERAPLALFGISLGGLELLAGMLFVLALAAFST